MIIIGIDPGTNITGYGIIKFSGSSLKRIESGIIRLPAAKSVHKRLEIIYDELFKLIKKYKPDEFAIETAFYGKNVQSAMKIGYARGVSILAALHNGINISEYSPREIKKSVVGKGSASKQQVNYMIKNILGLPQITMKSDESDALAIAICHAFRLKRTKSVKNDWKAFIEAFPERVIS